MRNLKKSFLTERNNIRIDRLIYYSLPFLFGSFINPTSFSLFIILYLNFIFLFELMIILNDFYDKDIDKDNGIIRYWNEDVITVLMVLYISTSFIYNYYSINVVISMFISFILSLIYHIYPRTKQYFLLNNITLGLTAVYIYYWGNGNNSKLALYIFLFFTMATMYKDWKDIEGDEKNRIYTFPVLLKKFNINYYYGFFILGIFVLIVTIFIFISIYQNSYINNYLYLSGFIFIYYNLIKLIFIENINIEINYMKKLYIIAVTLFLISLI